MADIRKDNDQDADFAKLAADTDQFIAAMEQRKTTGELKDADHDALMDFLLGMSESELRQLLSDEARRKRLAALGHENIEFTQAIRNAAILNSEKFAQLVREAEQMISELENVKTTRKLENNDYNGLTEFLRKLGPAEWLLLMSDAARNKRLAELGYVALPEPRHPPEPPVVVRADALPAPMRHGFKEEVTVTRLSADEEERKQKQEAEAKVRAAAAEQRRKEEETHNHKVTSPKSRSQSADIVSRQQPESPREIQSAPIREASPPLASVVHGHNKHHKYIGPKGWEAKAKAKREQDRTQESTLVFERVKVAPIPEASSVVSGFKGIKKKANHVEKEEAAAPSARVEPVSDTAAKAQKKQ